MPAGIWPGAAVVTQLSRTLQTRRCDGVDEGPEAAGELLRRRHPAGSRGMRRLAEAARQVDLRQDALERPGEGGRVAPIDEEAVHLVLDDLGRSPGARRDDAAAAHEG